jgi:hypothetical protein
MKTRISILFAFTVFIISCGTHEFNRPDKYLLNKYNMELEEIGVLLECPLDSVEVFAKNAFILHSGGLVDMYCNEIAITQFKTDFTTKLNSGKGVRFSFRTIMDTYETHPNITFEFTTDGCTVHDNNKLVVRVDSIKAAIDKPARIIIENYGKLYNIVVDCDTVYYGNTELHATQHMIVKPLQGSDVRLTGIVFSDMNYDVNEQMGWEIDGFSYEDE